MCGVDESKANRSAVGGRGVRGNAQCDPAGGSDLSQSGFSRLGPLGGHGSINNPSCNVQANSRGVGRGLEGQFGGQVLGHTLLLLSRFPEYYRYSMCLFKPQRRQRPQHLSRQVKSRLTTILLLLYYQQTPGSTAQASQPPDHATLSSSRGARTSSSTASRRRGARASCSNSLSLVCFLAGVPDRGEFARAVACGALPLACRLDVVAAEPAALEHVAAGPVGAPCALDVAARAILVVADGLFPVEGGDLRGVVAARRAGDHGGGSGWFVGASLSEG